MTEKRREYLKKYTLEHKLQRKKYSKIYWEKNKNERSKYSKIYREQHKDKIKQDAKIYRQEHEEEIKKYNKEHKEDKKQYSIIYREKNHEKLREGKIKYGQENREKIREKELIRKYGIDKIKYDDLLIKQNYVCEICSKSETVKDKRTNIIRKLAVDHDHVTGKVRGLLCGNCNKGLGNFQDEISLLENAVKYSKKYNIIN